MMDDSDLTENGKPLPCVADRLAQLRPSKELLDYYRKKVTEYDKEHKEMFTKLDSFKCAFQDQVRVNIQICIFTGVFSLIPSGNFFCLLHV